MTAQISWGAAPATVDVTATLGSFVSWVLGAQGVASVEGTAEVTGAVNAPGRMSPIGLHLTVPRTEVPSSGPMSVRASGALPGLVFDQPGHATIDLDSDLAVHVIPRDASGNVITAGVSDFSCALDPGQNTEVLSFDVTPVPAPPTTTKAPAPVALGPTTSAAAAASATPTPIARPTGTPTVVLRAKSAVSTTGTWRIWPAVLGVLATGVITGLLWLKRRSRPTDPAETRASANRGRDV